MRALIWGVSLLWTVVIALVLAIVVRFVSFKHSVPDFSLLPSEMSGERVDQLIAHYRSHDYDLECAAAILRIEKIGADEDYACWAPVKKAFGGIPARLVSFHFARGELRHIRLTFPEESLEELQGFLNRDLARFPRREGPSKGHRKLQMWTTLHGVVVTGDTARAQDGDVLVLWISGRK